MSLGILQGGEYCNLTMEVRRLAFSTSARGFLNNQPGPGDTLFEIRKGNFSFTGCRVQTIDYWGPYYTDEGVPPNTFTSEAASGCPVEGSPNFFDMEYSGNAITMAELRNHAMDRLSNTPADEWDLFATLSLTQDIDDPILTIDSYAIRHRWWELRDPEFIAERVIPPSSLSGITNVGPTLNTWSPLTLRYALIVQRKRASHAKTPWGHQVPVCVRFDVVVQELIGVTWTDVSITEGSVLLSATAGNSSEPYVFPSPPESENNSFRIIMRNPRVFMPGTASFP